MSLPTRMVMYNIYGEKQGDCFANAGWWVDENGLYRILVTNFPTVVFDKPNVAYVGVYGFTFFIEMLYDFWVSPRDDVIAILKHIIDTRNEEYRLENQK